MLFASKTLGIDFLHVLGNFTAWLAPMACPGACQFGREGSWFVCRAGTGASAQHTMWLAEPRITGSETTHADQAAGNYGAADPAAYTPRAAPFPPRTASVTGEELFKLVD